MGENKEKRAAGCRLTVSDVCGNRAVALENDAVRAGILVGWGLTVYELVDKASGVDFMFRERLGLERTRGGLPSWPNPQGVFWDSFIGGWFELFPNAGKACEWNGTVYPQHGEILQCPWEMAVEEDTPERVRVRFTVRTRRTPFRVTRTMEIRAGRPCLYTEERIENLCPVPQKYLWGHHFTIGGDFLNENCRIDLAPSRLYAEPGAQNAASQLRAGGEGTLRAMPGVSGGTVDERPFPARDSHIREMLFAAEMDGCWAAATDQARGLGVALAWDPAVWPAMWLWKEACASRGFPFYGDTYALSFEPQVSATPRLADACADGTAAELPGWGERTAWITVAVSRGAAGAAGVLRDGTVLPAKN